MMMNRMTVRKRGKMRTISVQVSHSSRMFNSWLSAELLRRAMEQPHWLTGLAWPDWMGLFNLHNSLTLALPQFHPERKTTNRTKKYTTTVIVRISHLDHHHHCPQWGRIPKWNRAYGFVSIIQSNWQFHICPQIHPFALVNTSHIHLYTYI